jgi:hypothetical protein
MSALFDRLAKMVAGGGSRRDALKHLGGFLAGSFLAVLPSKAKSDDDDHHHHHRHHRHHHHHGAENEENEEIIEDIDEKCLTYCQPCSGLMGNVFAQCFEHCRRSLRRHPTAVLCGQCSATLPVTVCHGKTPICNASGICSAI